MSNTHGVPSVPGETATLTRKLSKDPAVRRGIKLVLDGLLACLAMSAAGAALGQGLPSLPGLASFAALALAVDIAFRFYSQHYRAVGLRDAWALALGNLVVAAVAGAVVIITGGGGSIGSELARTVAGLGPERVVLLGRGENSLWQAQMELARLLPSRGSVIPIFMDQIRRGGPLTVTHPDMVRYFMTIPEAAQLVMQAGLLGGSGKVFALDMGEPVRIFDLAREMVRLSGFTMGTDMHIRFTGLRPGEKLFEELFAAGEERQSQVHPKVFEAVQEPQDPMRLAQGLRVLMALMDHPDAGRERKILQCFMQMVPTYQPSAGGLGRFLPRDGESSAAMPAPASGPGARPRIAAWK
jgi:hypothetical protein